MTNLTSKQVTQAVAAYCRKHGYYARTVRTVTVLRQCAIREATIGGTWTAPNHGLPVRS